MKYLGIDPGFSGAWGMIDHHGNYVACGDMPHDGNTIKTSVMFAEISQARDGDDLEVCIEAVHAMPKQGVSSTFKFGVSYGCMLALADRLSSPTHLVTPQKWKKDLGLSRDKEDSLRMARLLFPNAPLARKKDNGRAEALLLASYLLEQLS